MVPLYSLSIEHVIFNLWIWNFDRFCLIDFSILSVNFSHVCIIYVKIYEKMSSGGLEVSLSIVKISVNVVNHCTIITWYKIVIDNCFCDGQSSKGNNSKSINDRVTILAFCMSTHVGWYLYKVSWIKLKRFSSYRVDKVFVMDKVPRKITQKV